jgi:hypothetical protein
LRAGRVASALLAAIAATAALTRAEALPGDETRVYFIPGFASAFDDLGELAGLFAIEGIPTEALPPIMWHVLVAEIATAYRHSGRALHIVLVGHSMGAVKAYDIAAALGRRGIPVDLIIGLDPLREASVPDNVARAVNYFLAPEVIPVRPAAGFSGVLINEIVGDEAAIAHHDIIYDEALIERAIAEILRLLD